MVNSENIRLLFKYPTRGRPELFRKTLQKYYDMITGRYQYQFLISMDTDDQLMNCREIRSFLDEKKNLRYVYGDSKTKIEACNADMEGVEFDILILVSDDMIPINPEFDWVIVSSMLEYFPDLDGALHFHDGSESGAKIITQSIMGVNLYHYFGYIYHPAYRSLWCDNEFTDIVRKMGKVRYIENVIVRHEWVSYTGHDKTHRKSERDYDVDHKIYLRRQALDFPSQSHH